MVGLTYVSGLTGLCHYGNIIQNSHATYDVTSTTLMDANPSYSYGVGGMAGITVDSALYNCQILNCKFDGTITNSVSAANIIHGGVIGGSYAGVTTQTNLVITDCVINNVTVTEP